jgi:CBS domain containing-hemolysin-like protein
MQSNYRPVETINLGRTTTFVNPQHSQLTLSSPATHFMTDFLAVHPIVVSGNTEVDPALRIMKESHVRLLLVEHDDEFIGIVSATDINGGKVLAYMAQNQISRRDEILVKHIMDDKQHVHGLDIEKVESASIGDILETIKHLNEQHILVVQKYLTSCSVRGLFSTTDIVRALHIDFDVEPHAKTFFELEQVIVSQVNRH